MRPDRVDEKRKNHRARDSPDGLKKSTFPNPVFEFVPKEKLSFKDFSVYESDPIFLFFEPYGLRFHASIRDLSQWESVKPRFEKQFVINAIKPTLEDVFIKSVEGKT